MRVVQPAVLVGAYDWDETLVPRAEFDARLKAVASKVAAAGLAGLVVYGNKIDNAALAYLTNFTPKLDAAFAFIAPNGSVRLHASGSPNMMVNAQRLTWVDGVKPLRDAGRHIADWAAELAPGPLGLWTTEAMPADLLPRLETALTERKLQDISTALDPLLREKSPLARDLVRGACAMLAAAVAALRQSASQGASAREAVIAAEKAAAATSAQDVRVLASMSHGGTPTALDYPRSGTFDPLLAYVAVRRAGYWAEGFVTLSAKPSATLNETQAALQAMIAAARIGATAAELRQAAQPKLAGLEIHPAAQPLVTGIGLSLVESEAEPGGVVRLDEGRSYSLKIGARKSENDSALLSAMIEPTASGADILWSSLA